MVHKRLKIGSELLPTIRNFYILLLRCASHTKVSKRIVIAHFVTKIFADKVVVKLQSRRKTFKIGSFGFLVFRGGVVQILDMHFQIWLTFEHVAGFG